MKLNKNVFGLAVAVIGLSAVAQVPRVFAQSRMDNKAEHKTERDTTSASVVISQVRAIEIAKGQLAGTVKNVHLQKRHGNAVWRIRILSTDGSQRGTFRIDATTGAILSSKIKNVHSHHDD